MLYIYKCEDCGTEFELKATLEEKEQKSPEKFKCFSCGSNNIKQQIKGASFISGDKGGHGGCAGGCCGGICG